MSESHGGNGQPREELLRQSRDVRTKLVRTVGRLDERRHGAFDLGKQLTRHLKLAALGAGLLVAGTAGAAAFVTYRAMTAVRRRRRARWRLVKDAWNQPERERRAQRGSFVGEVIRSLAFTLVTTLLGARLRRLVRRER